MVVCRANLASAMCRLLFAFCVLTLVAAAPSQGQIGSAYCFGTGCPCGNDDAAAGCGNHGFDADVTTGALLSASGSADLFADDLALTVSGVDRGQFGLLFMGSARAGVPAGDGILCIGAGASGLWRFPVFKADPSGQFSLLNPVTLSQGFGAGGQILSGSTWGFQAWYRDPKGPCGTGANFSNALDVTFEAPGTSAPTRAQLAGNKLSVYPYFEYIASINEGARARAALDSTRFPWLVGVTGDLYVVAAKGKLRWDVDPVLLDVRGAPKAVTIQTGGTQANTFLLAKGTLNGTAGIDLGVGYDVVFDADQNGLLGPGDVIDGYSAEAGFYVVRDTAILGPEPVTALLYSGGAWLQQNIFYPTNITSLGPRPLIVISHGNGHDYRWYDHIGEHMASYGYVVMSHSNNTNPGIETASLTTINNTDHFLGNLGVIASGALNGLVDGTRIVWLGHSRGGEGVVRAYDRIVDGENVPTFFTWQDIRLVSSIAPTTFLDKNKVLPHGVPYHLWIGSADADVTGAPGSGQEPYTILERAEGDKMSITIQGAGHAVFHNGGGNWWASGPCLNGPTRVHKIVKGYFLPLVDHVVGGGPAGRDFLWRHYEAFQPISAPPNGNGCIVVNLELHEKNGPGVFVIDDFQTNKALGKSSSGQSVTSNVLEMSEGRLDDKNSSLAWDGSDPFNGMTRNVRTADKQKGLVFSFDNTPSFIEWAVDPEQSNLADDTYLSFRACQGTRHPLTAAVLEDVTFEVSLRDTQGVTSTLAIDAFGGGISEPYQRTGLGSGAGWSNEFETIRIRLTDFLADGSGLNLARIEAVRFDMGPGHGSNEGRLGLDDVEVIR
jgi:hypothetical protein